MQLSGDDRTRHKKDSSSGCNSIKAGGNRTATPLPSEVLPYQDSRREALHPCYLLQHCHLDTQYKQGKFSSKYIKLIHHFMNFITKAQKTTFQLGIQSMPTTGTNPLRQYPDEHVNMWRPHSHMVAYNKLTPASV